MSPRRHGSERSVPSASRRDTCHSSRSARADDRGDVGRLELAQLVGGRLLERRASVPSSTTGAPDRDARRATGLERDVLGLRLGLGHDELAEHVVDEVDHRAGGAEVAGELAGRGAERRTGAEERRDVGAAEAVDRLLGVAHHEQPARVDRRARPSGGRARRARPTRAARRGRTGWGRCPGTRRAAGACSARAAVGGRPSRARGRAAAPRASTSRSWNSSSPRAPPGGGLAQGELRQLPRQPPHDGLGDASASVGHELAHRGRPRRGRRRRARRRASCPCVPCRRLPFGAPTVSRRSCSYSSGACEQLRRATPRASSDLLERACRRRSRQCAAQRRTDRASAASTGASAARAAAGRARDPCARRRGPSWRCTRARACAAPARRGVGVEREEQRALERGVVEQLVDEAGPALLERELRRDVVEHLDARREPGLDRVLGEEPLRERVQGGHRGAVELLERAAAARAPRRPCRRRAARSLERAADAVAQLGRGLLGERDRGDLAHRARRGRVTSATTRSTSALVLPDPAPASTNSVSSSALDDRGTRARGPRRGRGSSAGPRPVVVAGTCGAVVSRSDHRRRRFGDVGLGERDVAAQLGRVALARPLAVAVAGAARVGVGVAAPPARPRARAGRPGRGTRRRRCRRRWRAARRRRGASTSGVSTSSAHRNCPRVLTYQYAAPTGVSGVAERRPRRVRVHGELQHRARRGGVVGVDAVRACRSCSR